MLWLNKTVGIAPVNGTLEPLIFGLKKSKQVLYFIHHIQQYTKLSISPSFSLPPPLLFLGREEARIDDSEPQEAGMMEKWFRFLCGGVPETPQQVFFFFFLEEFFSFPFSFSFSRLSSPFLH